VTSVAAESGTPTACPSNDSRVALFGLLLETNARLERQLGAALEGAMGLPLSWFEVLLRVERSEAGYLSTASRPRDSSSEACARAIDVASMSA
jgi:hypothetical protein